MGFSKPPGRPQISVDSSNLRGSNEVRSLNRQGATTISPHVKNSNQPCSIGQILPSLHSRRKRGRGERTREKNGVLGAGDEGTPATKTLIFSSPPTDFQVIQLS